jgi:hypothetical protein
MVGAHEGRGVGKNAGARLGVPINTNDGTTEGNIVGALDIVVGEIG